MDILRYPDAYLVDWHPEVFGEFAHGRYTPETSCRVGIHVLGAQPQLLRRLIRSSEPSVIEKELEERIYFYGPFFRHGMNPHSVLFKMLPRLGLQSG